MKTVLVKTIRIRTDNTVACACLTKARSAEPLSRILDRILKILEKENWNV